MKSGDNYLDTHRNARAHQSDPCVDLSSVHIILHRASRPDSGRLRRDRVKLG